MTSPFPSPKRYYVYKHWDRLSQVCVYVGHGSGGRAWQCGTSHSPLRCKDHCEWADNLLHAGHTPEEWVEIVAKDLSKQEACDFENGLIKQLRPVFNRTLRSPLLKFTPDIYDKALEWREQGWSYEKIGKEVGLSTMVIHRGINKMPVSLETALAER